MLRFPKNGGIANHNFINYLHIQTSGDNINEDREFLKLSYSVGNTANSQTKVYNCLHAQNSGDNINEDREFSKSL